MSILAGLFTAIFLRLLGKRRRFLAACLSAAGIGLYTVLVGGDAAVVRAAVVRAAVMGGLSLFARQLGRRQDGFNSLAFVAGVMALLNPQVLWDVGFQLSFAATLGLILYADPFAQAFQRFASRFLPSTTAQRLTGPVGEYFLFTLAAQLTTLPVTVYHFRRLSLVSLLANPAILPAQPPVMILGGLALLLGLAYLPLGQAVAYLLWPAVAFTIRTVEWFARFPSGTLVLGQVSLLVVIGFYSLLLASTFAASFASRAGRALAWAATRLTAAPTVLLAGLSIASVLTWRVVFTLPDGRLHLVVLEVGSGDALLIQAPGGRRLLVDGGPDPTALSDTLGRRLPLFERRLDWLVVGGIQAGQLGALPRSLERFPPGQVLWSGAPLGTFEARRLQAGLAQVGIPVHRARAGQRLDLGQGASLQVLAESGYAPANPPEWIEKLNPQVILLSVAAGDRDGLPDPRTLEAVGERLLLRTDRNGWIHLSTDGEQMWVEVEVE